MTASFMPSGEQDTTGRIIVMEGAISGGAGGTVQVLNQTGRALTLIGFNATASAVAGNPTADIQNATGTMLTGAVAIVVSVGTAGVIAANNQIAIGGTVDFVFTGAGGDINLQATAFFTAAV